jgi:hypothetical protein
MALLLVFLLVMLSSYLFECAPSILMIRSHENVAVNIEDEYLTVSMASGRHRAKTRKINKLGQQRSSTIYFAHNE